MRKLLLALLVALLAMYCLDAIFAGQGHDHYGAYAEPLLNGLKWGLPILIGLLVALSVAGVVALVLVTVVLALIFAGMAAFWPVILALMLVMVLVRDKSAKP